MKKTNISILIQWRSLRASSGRVQPFLYAAALASFLIISAAPAPGRIVNAPPDDDHDGHKKPTISLTKVNDLNFGAVFTGNGPGTITVLPSGAATYSGSAISFHMPGVNTQAALFLLNIVNPAHKEDDDEHEYEEHEHDDEKSDDDRCSFSRDGCFLTVALPSSVTLVRDHGVETMNANEFTIMRNQGSINVGATLHVNAQQMPGTYHGIFAVTVICD